MVKEPLKTVTILWLKVITSVLLFLVVTASLFWWWLDLDFIGFSEQVILFITAFLLAVIGSIVAMRTEIRVS